MANKKIKGITIEIGADTLGLDKALREVESGSKKAASELREVNTTIKKAGDSAVLWKQKQDLLTTALEESKKKLELLETAQDQVKKQLESGAINGDQYRAFEREVEYARSAVEKYETELKDANEKVKEFGTESDNTAEDVKDLGNEAEGAANGGINTMTVALGNLVADGIELAAGKMKDFTKDVVTTGASFEAAMSEVGAISSASAEDMALLTDKAEQMGASTKFTAAESAEAFKYMAMAGWKTEDMLSGIDGVLSLAAASGESLGTTSDIVTDAMTAFGLSADQAGHFADVLAASASNANTNVGMMGETFKYAAPVAGALKYSIEDTAEAIGLMANSGIKATMAGTALRSIITRLSTNAGATKTSLGALDILVGQLGVEFYNADGSARDFGEVLAETREKWKDLNDEEQTSYAKKIAGTNAISGWLALMNAAPADVEKLSGAIRDCNGAATDMSTVMIDNLQGDMTIFESAMDGMKISLAKEMTPALRETVQYATKNIPKVESVLSGVFKTGMTGINFVVKHLPEIGSAIKTLTPVVTGSLSAIAAYKTFSKVEKGISAVKKLNDSIKAGNSVMKALNITMGLSPLGAVAIGVGTLTAAVVALKLAHEDEETELDRINKAYEEEKEKLDDARQAMNDMKNTFDDRAVSISNETQRTKDLWNELDKLTDSTGRVQDKDKEHAQYILGELNEALGTEYELTGNQIKGYQELADQIDEVIAKKEAEQLIDSYSADSGEMRKRYLEAQEEYYNYIKESDAAKVEQAKIAADIFKNTGYNLKQMSIGEVKEKLELTGADISLSYPIYDKLEEYENAMQKQMNNDDLAATAKRNYEEASVYLDRLKRAQEAMYSGDYNKVATELYAGVNRNMSTLRNYAEHEQYELQQAYKEEMNRLLSDLSLAFKSGSQRGVDEVMASLEQTTELAKKAGINSSDEFVDEFSAIVNEMLNKGFDISELTRWGKNSGINIADVFQGDFKKLVQSQLDKGFDVQDLILWGAKSGLLTGDSYDAEFERTIQEALKNFYPDISGLMEWAKESGIAVGELFGEHFEAYVNQYRYAANDLIPHNINSDADARYYNSGAYDLGLQGIPKHATGGFIGIGERGIVAEAGPELLEIMNGGIKVTPLSRTAKNTPVSETGAGSNIVSINNYIDAKITSRYDIRRLAEDLATEENLMLSAKGLK